MPLWAEGIGLADLYKFNLLSDMNDCTERRHRIGARGHARVSIDTIPNFTLILAKALSISKVYIGKEDKDRIKEKLGTSSYNFHNDLRNDQ
jgi:hypothetical protein